MNSLYASGSLLYRSRDFGTAGGNRFRSDSTTWRPISSCTSKTLSRTKSCCSEEMTLLRHRIEQVHRDAPVCSQLLDVPLQEVARPQITARAGGVGPSRIVQDRRCRKDGNVVEPAEHRNQRIRKPQRQSFAVFDFAQENKRQHGNRRERCRARHARCGRSREAARLPRASRTASAT